MKFLLQFSIIVCCRLAEILNDVRKTCSDLVFYEALQQSFNVG